MGTIRKIGDEFYIEFHARGLLYQQKAGRDEKAARKLLNDIEDKIRRGEIEAMDRDADIDIFFVTFLDHCRSMHTTRSYRRYESVIQHFQGFCRLEGLSGGKLSGITPGVIENYRAHLVRMDARGRLELKPKLVNLTLFLLRDIMDYAIKLGYLNDNPLLHTRWAAEGDTRPPRTVAVAVVERVMARCGDDLKDIVTVVLHTGLRARELVGLKWTKIDFKNKMITIEASYGPAVGGVQQRTIPIDRDVEAVLYRFQMKNATGPGLVFVNDNGRAFQERGLTEELKQAAASAGVEGEVNFEILRNTFACDLLGRRIGLADVARLLGFNDIARVMRYKDFLQRADL